MSAPSYAFHQAGLRGALRSVADRWLARDPAGAALRATTVTVLFLLFWFGLAWGLAPSPAPSPDWLSGLPFPIDAMGRVLVSLIMPAVLMHVAPVAAGLWLGYRLSAHYLADLFELEAYGMAARFVRSAALGSGYDLLTVASGDMNQLDWTSPVVRVGGPGRLAVHLGFAAVFETVEGHPRVYGPAASQSIGGFERLRDVIDLRDQMRPVEEIRSTTRDGVEVCARDVQMMFRVFGGGRPRGLKDPYPFTEEAIRRLVYAQTVGEHGLERWTDALPELIRAEISSFVSGLTLEEFLALQPAAPDAGSHPHPMAFHIPRRRLTERFHTEELRRRLQQAGLELAWVGVGMWEVPPAGPHPDETLTQALASIGPGAGQEHTQDKADPRAQPDVHSLARAFLHAWNSAAERGSDRKAALLNQVRSSLAQLDEDAAPGEAGRPTPSIQAVLEHLASFQPGGLKESPS